MENWDIREENSDRSLHEPAGDTMSSHLMRILVLFIFLSCHSIISAQVTRVALDQLTALDEPSGILEVFRPKPIIPVKLPSVDTTGAQFIKLFSFWKKEKGNFLVIMIIPKTDRQELYIDLNYNNDLTDDGPPRVFLNSQNEMQFDMVNNTDQQQRIRMSYIRKPDPKKYGDQKEFIDAHGNLTKKIIQNVELFDRIKDFPGKVGTFYWNDRITVRRGNIRVGNGSYLIGLQDFTYSGLYNEKQDLIYVDNNHTGKIIFMFNNNKYQLTDTFSIGNVYFRVKEADKYGKWIDLERVKGKRTMFYINRIDSTNAVGASFGTIDPSWKSIALISLDARNIDLGSYSGKPVLLNFWGEWCKPCIDEIPELKRLHADVPQLQMISFLEVNDLQKAKQIITDSAMSWPHFLLPEELKKKFKIEGFPTNILILPNGRNLIVAGNLSNTSLKEYIH